MIARASQLYLPTLRDDPADAEAASHKLLVRGGFIRQVSAGLWTFMPLGWRVHRKVEQIIREEMDAIGSQEMFAPVLTPAELWSERPLRDPGALQAEDRTGRDYVLPLTHEETFTFHARRAPELQAAAAALVPLPDEGSRRAAAERRAHPRARVRHEGLVLVRPRRGGPRRELRAQPGGVRDDLRALRPRDVHGAGRVGDHGRHRVVRLPRALGIRREHARHVRERRLRGRPRDRARHSARAGLPGAARRAGRDRDAGHRRRSRRWRSCSRRRGGDVEGDAAYEERRHGRARARARRRPARGGEAPRGRGRRLAPRRPRTRSGRPSAPTRARSGRSASRARSSPTRRSARGSSSPAPTAPAGTSAASRQGRDYQAALRRHPRAEGGRPLPALRRRAPASRPRSRSATSSSSARSSRSRSGRRTSTRTGTRSRSSWARTESAPAA